MLNRVAANINSFTVYHRSMGTPNEAPPFIKIKLKLIRETSYFLGFYWMRMILNVFSNF